MARPRAQVLITVKIAAEQQWKPSAMRDLLGVREKNARSMHREYPHGHDRRRRSTLRVMPVTRYMSKVVMIMEPETVMP